MKIIQISDLHLTPPGESLHGVDPWARLDSLLKDLASRHADADLLMATGDLTHHGEASAYAALRERLAGVRIPVRLLLGNHDERRAFAAAFPGQPLKEGYAQGFLDAPEGRILWLDTLDPGRGEGKLDPARLLWLERRLDEAAGRRVLVFLHHPPVETGIPLMDRLALAQSAELLALLRAHGGVEGVFGGHVHRPFMGLVEGLPVGVVKSVHHQTRLNFADPYAREMAATPGYGVIHWRPGFVRIHFEEFDLSS